MVRRYPKTGSARGSRGFTLLEVLLAFVVFALSFAVVLEILGGSMRNSVRAREYTEAALLGQSLMDLVGTEIPIEEGGRDGEMPGGYRWRMDISPYVPDDDDVRTLEVAELSATMLYWVDLEVAWGQAPRDRQAHFSTVRSKQVPQP
jgi:general secretion pathway protein I